MPRQKLLCLKWPELRKTRPGLRAKQIEFGCNGPRRTKTEQNEAAERSSSRGGGGRHARTKQLRVISCRWTGFSQPWPGFKICNKSFYSLQFGTFLEMQRCYYNTSSHFTSRWFAAQHESVGRGIWISVRGECLYPSQVRQAWKKDTSLKVKFINLWCVDTYGLELHAAGQRNQRQTIQLKWASSLDWNTTSTDKEPLPSETTVVWAVLPDTSPVPTWDPSLDIWGRICAPVPFRWRTWLMENYWTQMTDNIITGKNVTIFDTESSSAPSVDKNLQLAFC